LAVPPSNGAVSAVHERRRTVADLDRAITSIVEALSDGHSFYLNPSESAWLKSSAGSTPTKPFVRAAPRAPRDFPTIRLEGYLGFETQAVVKAALEVRNTLEQAQQPNSACTGLVVDLRDNTGGNVWPMLMGLLPLFPDGKLFSFRDVDGTDTDVAATAGSLRVGVEVPIASLALTPMPRPRAIAILVGPRTASSGELVAIALRGLEPSKTFGEPSAGQTTANQPFDLPNGGTLVLATAVVVGRSGSPQVGRLQPDVRVPARQEGKLQELAQLWMSTECKSPKT
jgi:carboxyl-terminal processing protease